MDAQAAWRDVADVEKEELVNMAENIFDNLVKAIGDLGGHQLADNVKQFADALDQEMVKGLFPTQGATEMIQGLWNKLSPQLTAWVGGILKGSGVEEILSALASGTVSPELLGQIARLSESEPVIKIIQQITEQTDQLQTLAVERVVEWTSSESVNQVVLLLMRAQALMQIVLSPEIVALATHLHKAAPAMDRLTELMAHPQFMRVLDLSAHIVQNEQFLSLLEGLEGHIDTAAVLLEHLSRFERQGGLTMMTRLVDLMTSPGWDQTPFEDMPEMINRELAFAHWAFESSLPEITQNMLLTLDVSVDEARKDTNKYGAMRLMGTLKDPVIQDGIKVGLAFLRHLPIILNAKAPEPPSPPANSSSEVEPSGAGKEIG
jgi:hypothetical protein